MVIELVHDSLVLLTGTAVFFALGFGWTLGTHAAHGALRLASSRRSQEPAE